MKANAKNTLIIVALLLLGLALRLRALDKYPLWYDEASVALEERGPLSLPSPLEFINPSFSLERQDYLFLYNHIFVYYWKKFFGDSEFALRSSSVIFGLLGLWMFYKMAGAIYDKQAAAISLLILSVSPFHLFYSQELRPYAAMCFFNLLGFYALYKLLQKQEKNIYWAVYALANIINIYLHYMTLVVLLAQFVLLLSCLKPLRKNIFKVMVLHFCILAAAVPVFLIIIPNLIFILTHNVPVDLTEFPVWAQKISLGNILYTLKNFSIGYNIDIYSPIGNAVTFLYLFLFIAFCLREKDKIRLVFVAVSVALPIAFIFIVSRFLKVCYVDRYFFSFFPVYILGVSCALRQQKRLIKNILFVLILFFATQGLINYYHDILPDNFDERIGVIPKDSNIDKITLYILNNFKEKDRIYCTSRLQIFPLKFYFAKFTRETKKGSSRASIPYELISEIKEGKMLWVDDRKRVMYVSNPETRPVIQVPRKFEFGEGVYRIWVIHNILDPREEIVDYLKINSSAEYEYDFKNLRLILFSFGPSGLKVPGGN